MLTSMASLTWSRAPGDVVDVEDYVAEAWAEAGIAALVVEKPLDAPEPAQEAVAVSLPEKAAPSPIRGRKGR